MLLKSSLVGQNGKCRLVVFFVVQQQPANLVQSRVILPEMRIEIGWENAENLLNESIFYYFMNERKWSESTREQKGAQECPCFMAS